MVIIDTDPAAKRGLPYAKKDLSYGADASELAGRHLVHFWAGRVVIEGRVVPRGPFIDEDELMDPLLQADIADWDDPEALNGRVAVQHGELLLEPEEIESSCSACLKLWCPRSLKDISCAEEERLLDVMGG